MKISPLALDGAFLIESEPFTDERGHFRRIWCRNEFARHGVELSLVQASMSHTERSGSIRGMHFQIPPSREGKLIRCTRGRIFDVVVDIRPRSATFLQHESVSLGPDSGEALFLPSGFAHGFQTLTDDVDVFYEMTDVYQPDLARGFRWNDPSTAIKWPLPVSVISARDKSYEDLKPDDFRAFE